MENAKLQDALVENAKRQLSTTNEPSNGKEQ
jgi:hypothetical protein